MKKVTLVVILRGKAGCREDRVEEVFEEAEHQEARVHRAQGNEVGGEDEGEEGRAGRA